MEIDEKYDPTKDEIVMRFVEELKKTIPSKLKNVILYGSRARGDYKKHSDYDFLIILTQKNKKINDIIYDIGYLILDTYELIASCMIWDEKDWEYKKDFSLTKKILKDGVSLL